MKLTGRWFPQIVDRDSGNLYISNIYQTKIVVLASEPVGGRSRATEFPCLILISISKIIEHFVTCQKFCCGSQNGSISYISR